MASTSSQSFSFAIKQMTIYFGIPSFILGVIGGSLNVIVFLSLKTFRQSSCAFYLTIMSIVNTLHLFIGLLPFIMIKGFNTNWTDMSLFYCKFRAFYVQFNILMSPTCMCLATIDQFLATCSNPRWHQWNNTKFARYMVIGATIFWMLHGIPFVMFYNHILSPITNKIICDITNVIFTKYFTIVQSAVLSTSLPVTIMALFGILAYRNVTQIAYRTVPLIRRELDKQLTVMVLVQVFYNVLTVTPVIIQSDRKSVV